MEFCAINKVIEHKMFLVFIKIQIILKKTFHDHSIYFTVVWPPVEKVLPHFSLWYNSLQAMYYNVYFSSNNIPQFLDWPEDH